MGKEPVKNKVPTRWILLFGVALLAFAGYGLFDQWRQSIWSEPFNHAMEAYHQPQYSEAEQIILAALPEVERRWPDGSPIGYEMYPLGIAYEAQSRFPEAEKALKQSLAIREKAKPVKPVDGGASHLALGRTYWDESRLVEAEQQLRIALTFLRPIRHHTDTLLADTLGNLGQLCTDQARYRGPISAYLQHCTPLRANLDRSWNAYEMYQ